MTNEASVCASDVRSFNWGTTHMTYFEVFELLESNHSNFRVVVLCLPFPLWPITWHNREMIRALRKASFGTIKQTTEEGNEMN